MYSLITKSQENWNSTLSGDLNKLNTNFLFETDNEFGFPEVCTSKDFNCTDLIDFLSAKKRKSENMNKGVHFFLDDYKFERIWTKPTDYILLFQDYGNIVSPTFSIWSNQPYALNLFNVYRSRWITRFFQEYSVNVLVDARWSDEKSYDYCFSGIQKNSPVIVNTVGTHQLENRRLFQRGFEEMLNRVEPSDLYVYGEYLPVKFEKYFDSVTYYDSYWKKKRDKMKEEELNGK